MTTFALLAVGFPFSLILLELGLIHPLAISLSKKKSAFIEWTIKISNFALTLNLILIEIGFNFSAIL